MVREEGRGVSRVAPPAKGGPSGRGTNRPKIPKRGKMPKGWGVKDRGRSEKNNPETKK
jgi:hypothetical protein